ncbi:uncharacterized protein M421DRAFT_418246 [Didymella exigua CBS 183.55]|uniref:Apple domain-containing protein n=1 Tax=Didymella exigua CBS 183.55 TaxID=1150837 RepID=A0A6A5RWV3_9PLEO|nr:uncharacterized protein M421DRAFT_418246 [Didymella exigua CBS 183.55]KAF1930766.1 hypothetical protein M421DRAFT_418246 [Didymella exigua CBS 183.55]
MYFSTAVIAAFAATYVSASPLMVRDNVCGTTPAGSNANNQPISQPSGIQTSAACQAQCEADNSCQSFTFGMIDNTIQCKLYSCAASAVPSQSSANLVVYDKACTAVPSVVPTSSNPTGKKRQPDQRQPDQRQPDQRQPDQRQPDQRQPDPDQLKPQFPDLPAGGSGWHTEAVIHQPQGAVCSEAVLPDWYPDLRHSALGLNQQPAHQHSFRHLRGSMQGSVPDQQLLQVLHLWHSQQRCHLQALRRGCRPGPCAQQLCSEERAQGLRRWLL